MTEPIVFISHFRIKEGKLDGLKEKLQEGARTLEAEKPLTAAFLPYVNDEGTEVSIVHVFGDPDAMDVHVQGAEERSRSAYEFMEPAGWEIYGRPSDVVMQMMRERASSADVPLTVRPDYPGGFLRIDIG